MPVTGFPPTLDGIISSPVADSLQPETVYPFPSSFSANAKSLTPAAYAVKTVAGKADSTSSAARNADKNFLDFFIDFPPLLCLIK
jgi:hypothetical protein